MKMKLLLGFSLLSLISCSSYVGGIKTEDQKVISKESLLYEYSFNGKNINSWEVLESPEITYSELRKFKERQSRSQLRTPCTILGIKIQYSEDYDFGSFSVLLKEPIEIPSGTDKLTFWWAGRSFNEEIYCAFMNDDNLILKKAGIIDFGGWKLMEYDIEDDFDYFAGFVVNQNISSIDTSLYYFYYIAYIDFYLYE